MITIHRADFARSLARWKPDPDFPATPHVCFAGRSNVGKSSLLNCLVQRKTLARTSNTPGRTQMINLFDVEMSSEGRRLELRFADLPGYGYAKVPGAVKRQWEPMIRGFVHGNPTLKLAVLLLDMRREPSGEDLGFVEILGKAAVPTLVVLTKADKLSGNERSKQIRLIAGSLGIDRDDLLEFSSVTRKGREELLEDIFRIVTEPT